MKSTRVAEVVDHYNSLQGALPFFAVKVRISDLVITSAIPDLSGGILKHRNKLEENVLKTKSLLKTIGFSVSAVLIICFISFLIFLFIISLQSPSPEEQIENKNKMAYGVHTVNKNLQSEIDLNDYITLPESDGFYLDGPGDDSINLSKYYLDSEKAFYRDGTYTKNKTFTAETAGNYFYFFGSDESSLHFCLKINAGYSDDCWYMQKDYTVPSVEKNNVSKLLIVQELCAFSRTESHPDFYRIDTNNAATVTDKQEINDCLQLYRKKEYCLKSMEKYKLKSYPQQYYLVLAAFENDSLYQCIGYFYN